VRATRRPVLPRPHVLPRIRPVITRWLTHQSQSSMSSSSSRASPHEPIGARARARQGRADGRQGDLHRRPPRRVRARLRLPDVSRERGVRGRVSSRNVHRAPAHREAADRDRARGWRGRGVPRRHGQGQRSGAFCHLTPVPVRPRRRVARRSSRRSSFARCPPHVSTRENVINQSRVQLTDTCLPSANQTTLRINYCDNAGGRWCAQMDAGAVFAFLTAISVVPSAVANSMNSCGPW